MSSPAPPIARPVSPRQQEILPTLFGHGYGNYPVQNKTYLYSLLVHMLAAALVVAVTTYAVNNPEKVQQQLQNISLDISPYIMSAGKTSGGGGGGGDHDKLNAPKGALPKTARDQFTPPEVVIRNPEPKMAITPTVVAPEIKVAAPNLGDPLMALTTPPSNGIGGPAGIGNGQGTGVGAGRDSGTGMGWGGGAGGGAYRVGGGVTPPRVLYNPDPEYSEEARKAKYQGTVVLWVVIGPDGRVHDMRVARALGMGLDEKALEAVKTWKFEPGRKDGQAVAVQMNVEVDFRLY